MISMAQKAKYQISFSGGVASAVTALIAHEQGLEYNLIFADTLIEDEDLYRFVEDVGAVVGKDIIYLRDGRTPWDVYVDRKHIGNTRLAHCSEELKTKPIKRWIDENANPNDPLVLGFDMSELDRLHRRQKQWAPRPLVSLLNDYKVYRPHFDAMLAKYGLVKGRQYNKGFLHDNCGGFCCKAGQGQFERLYRLDPERYAYHEAEQERAMREIGPTARPFLRQTVDGELQYITLREFREQLERRPPELSLFDEGSACDCF